MRLSLALFSVLCILERFPPGVDDTFPPSISRKRAEANFLCSFERAFVAGHCQTKQITWRDFALQGYGIPDLITFAWSTQQNQATVLSLEALRQKLQRQQLITASTSSARWSSPRARLRSQCEVARGFFSKSIVQQHPRNLPFSTA